MCVFVVVVFYIKIHRDQTRICTMKHFRLSFLFVLVTVLSSEDRFGQGMAEQSREGQVRAKQEALERGRTGQYMTGNAYVYKFWARHMGSDCSNSWSLHTCYFYRQNELTFSLFFSLFCFSILLLCVFVVGAVCVVIVVVAVVDVLLSFSEWCLEREVKFDFRFLTWVSSSTLNTTFRKHVLAIFSNF